MPGSLKSLAGAAFREADVIGYRHPPIPVEQLVLDQYVFMPHVRSGIAAALSSPFSWESASRASIMIRTPVIDDRGGLDAEMPVEVQGPASVLELGIGQVIRTHPKANAADVEAEDLVHVEFDRPDLPWMFTPTGPDGSGRLVPWMTLVVAERRYLRWGRTIGATREADIRRDQLQPLGGAWAWAHAHVMGTKNGAVSLEQRLSETNAAHNLSRLICPRRLAPMTEYIACLVPTFRCGAEAGLGLKPSVATLAPSWGLPTDFNTGDPASMIKLPVYFSWTFATGLKGNFESLARQLKPAAAPAGVGRRRVDATQPWPGADIAAADPGAEIIVEGPLTSLVEPADDAAGNWPADKQWSDEIEGELARRLNLQETEAHRASTGDGDEDGESLPSVGPPLYGAAHIREKRIETDSLLAGGQPLWFRELNLDPRNRIVAGLGARVVQSEQEDLMVSAWNQVIGVNAANQTLRMAQLAMHISASLHARHLSRFGNAALLAVTERVHPKLLDAPSRSAWSSLKESSLPCSTTLGAFRRLAAVRGRIVRRAIDLPEDRREHVDRLTVTHADLTADWVRTYVDPDGIVKVGPLTQAMVTSQVAALIGVASTPQALAARWNAELAKPGLIEALAPEALVRFSEGDPIDLRAGLAEMLVGRILKAMPAMDALHNDHDLSLAAGSNGFSLAALASAAARLRLNPVAVARADARRLRLDFVEDGAVLRVKWKVLAELASRMIEMVRELGIRPMPWEMFEQSASKLTSLIDRSQPLERPAALAGLSAMSKKLINSDSFLDRPRAQLSVPALGLLQSLDPYVTVPRRISARLAGGSGFPDWLSAGWFAGGRLETVMAHPRFRYPMYEPLHRYDPEWMIAGMRLLKQIDVVTVLETNNRFIEAYMVGLNHEMARELLWRSYPTDQRGTYFDSFWTGRTELVADMHEPLWRSGPLASHVDPKLEGRLVFLVRGDLIRRYPGVVAQLVRQGLDDDGRLLSDAGIPLFEKGDALTPRKTLFQVRLAPNVMLAGFDIRREELDVVGETWWFTLSENPTEPRFGLDSSAGGQLARDDLAFADFDTLPGGFLDAMRAFPAITATGPGGDQTKWGQSSAQTAYLLFQLPARAAFLAKRMVEKASPPNG